MTDTKRKPPAAGKGRPKGSRNKTTAAIKDMLLQALDEAHSGGAVEYLKSQAAQNPVAFMGLIGKVIPLQVNGAGEGGEHVHKIVREIVRSPHQDR